MSGCRPYAKSPVGRGGSSAKAICPKVSSIDSITADRPSPAMAQSASRLHRLSPKPPTGASPARSASPTASALPHKANEAPFALAFWRADSTDSSRPNRARGTSTPTACPAGDGAARAPSGSIHPSAPGTSCSGRAARASKNGREPGRKGGGAERGADGRAAASNPTACGSPRSASRPDSASLLKALRAESGRDNPSPTQQSIFRVKKGVPPVF